MFSKDTDNKCVMHSKSYNIEFITAKKTDEALSTFKSFCSRYQHVPIELNELNQMYH